MKTILLSIAVAAAGLFTLTPTVEAQTGFRFSFGTGHGPGHRVHPGHRPGYHPGHHARSHRGPVYKVRTVEVRRHRQMVTSRLPNGRPYSRPVTVVTYRDYFSNGTSRDYTRTSS